MAVYFSATIRIHDADRYQVYLDRYDEAFAGTGGEVLAVDDAVTVLEGQPRAGRVVLIRFPDEAAFRAWYDSPAYAAIAQHRRAASDADIVLVRGR